MWVGELTTMHSSQQIAAQLPGSNKISGDWSNVDQTQVGELTTGLPSSQVLFLYKSNVIRFWKSSSSDRIVRWFFFVRVKYTNQNNCIALKWIIGNIKQKTSNMSGLNFMKETLKKFRTVKKCTIRKNGNGSCIFFQNTYVSYLVTQCPEQILGGHGWRTENSILSTCFT